MTNAEAIHMLAASIEYAEANNMTFCGFAEHPSKTYFDIYTVEGHANKTFIRVYPDPEASLAVIMDLNQTEEP